VQKYLARYLRCFATKHLLGDDCPMVTGWITCQADQSSPAIVIQCHTSGVSWGIASNTAHVAGNERHLLSTATPYRGNVAFMHISALDRQGCGDSTAPCSESIGLDAWGHTSPWGWFCQPAKDLGMLWETCVTVHRLWPGTPGESCAPACQLGLLSWTRS
jgi:hypothetical protein